MVLLASSARGLLVAPHHLVFAASSTASVRSACAPHIRRPLGNLPARSPSVYQQASSQPRTRVVRVVTCKVSEGRTVPPESKADSAGSPATSAPATDGQPASKDKNKSPQPAAAQGSDSHVTSSGHGLKTFHLVTFFIILAAGLMFLTVLLYFTGGIQFQRAMAKVLKRLLKTVALRQVVGILAAMAFVRFGLEPLVKTLRQVFAAQGSWEKSSEFYILREVYRPLEFLFSVAAFTTLAENFLPQLISLPKALVQTLVRSTLSLTFVIAAARVVFSIKARMTREATWQLELKGDVTKQRRVEAFDKLLSVLTLLVASVFGLQAIGLDVNSVLAIGGVGGLAVGLAGREILENLFTGLIILSSSPFEVGDEVLFTPPSGQVVEGIVVDVGWYRTTIRSFEREIFNIPNSVFSRNVVLNITRKQKEWRFYEFMGVRVEDTGKVQAIVADMRKVIRQDPRIIQKLHRRVFLDKITREQASIYISCYVEAVNRDAFMAVKQDLLLAFVDCVERNSSKLARNRLQVEVQPSQFIPPSSPAKAATPKDAADPARDLKALPAASAAEGQSPAIDVSPAAPSAGGGPLSTSDNDAGRSTSSSPTGVSSGAGAGGGGASSRSNSGTSTTAPAPSSSTTSGGSRADSATQRVAVAAAAAYAFSSKAEPSSSSTYSSGFSADDISLGEQLGSLITASFDDIA